MARPRVQRLGVEPGQPPPAGGDDVEHEHQADELEPQPVQLGVGDVVEQVEQWEQASVELLVGGVCMLLHLTVGRGGPEDAFIPTPAEKGEMASPLTRMLNRSVRARSAAKYGDAGALALSAGGFVVSEAERTIAYRRDAAGGEPPARVDEDIASLGTVEQREGVRPWRPPTPPPE